MTINEAFDMNIDNVEAATEVQDELKSTDTLPKAEPETPDIQEATEKDQAEEQAEKPADDVESETDDTDSAQKPKRLPKWLKKQLAETHAEKRQLKEKLAELEKQLEQKAPPPVDRELTLEDFDYDQVAYARHVAKEAAKQAIAEQEQRQKAEKEKEEAQSRNKVFADRVADLEAEVGAGVWEDVCNSPIRTTPEILDFVQTSDHGVKVAYYLSQNLEDAERISSLPRHRQYQALAEIEDRLSNPAKPEPRVTKAPPPPPTVKGAASSPKTADDPNLSTAERIALWKQAKRR